MFSLVLMLIWFHTLVIIDCSLQNRVNPFTSNLVCGNNQLIASVNFQQPFNGIIYAKGFPLECRVYGNGSQVIHFQTSIQECGVKTSQNTFSANQYEYELVLYVQNDANIEQATDEKIELKCLPQQRSQPQSSKFRVKSLYGESRIQVHQMRTHNFTLNDISDSLECRMDVMKGRLPFLKPIDGFVDLGQDITIIIKIKQIAGIDSHLSRCYAHDGTHSLKQELTNTNGCAIDTNILPNFNKISNYGSDSKLYYTTFPAFKFPDRTNLNIQCTVVICNTTCPQVDCNIKSNSYVRRVKRLSNGDNSSVSVTNEDKIDGHTNVSSYDVVLSEIGISNSIGVNSVESNKNKELNNSSFENKFTIELVSCLTSQMILNFGLLLTITFFATVFVCCYCGMKVRELNENQWSNKKYHQYNDSHQSLPHNTQIQDVHCDTHSYGPMLDLTN